MAHAGGRPTKYKPDYCDSVIAYFTIPPQQTVYKETYYANGQLKSKEPVVLANQFPTIYGFASEIGVNKDTIYQWIKDHKEFSDAFTRAQELQHNIWLVNGMGGQYNSQFAQFFGKNCLGYKDKVEADITGNLSLTDADRELLAKIANRQSENA